MGILLADRGNMPVIVQEEGNVPLWEAEAGVVIQGFAWHTVSLRMSLILATQWDFMKQYSKGKQH